MCVDFCVVDGGGKPEDPEFRELIVRWFQYGLTCPLFRQHGSRPTEIWLLGNESEAAIESTIALRNHLQPYIMQQMEQVSKTGQPINRLVPCNHHNRFID